MQIIMVYVTVNELIVLLSCLNKLNISPKLVGLRYTILLYIHQKETDYRMYQYNLYTSLFKEIFPNICAHFAYILFCIVSVYIILSIHQFRYSINRISNLNHCTKQGTGYILITSNLYSVIISLPSLKIVKNKYR